MNIQYIHVNATLLLLSIGLNIEELMLSWT